VANNIEAIGPSMGGGVRDPNLEFGVDRVEEEDWACGLRVWYRGYHRALVEWQRALQGVPKDEVTVTIVGREVGAWIVELDLRGVHNIPEEIWRQGWHYWLLLAFGILQLVNET
jgi:hypothetical protein